MGNRSHRPCVLVFAGHDPSGGAGIQADIEAIAAQGAHAIPIITALTVQDNNRVYAVHPVSAQILRAQFEAVIAQLPVASIKLGIIGSLENSQMIADCIRQIKQAQPDIPVVVDTVLASGHGDALANQDALQVLAPVLRCATLMTPNLPELRRLLADQVNEDDAYLAEMLCQRYGCDVLLKGGHASGDEVRNEWYRPATAPIVEVRRKAWYWPRLQGEFHGSGCTLAAAIAGQFALGRQTEQALSLAQNYVQQSLRDAYMIAPGQFIPSRTQFQETV
jgi:hydroxymethylpyrimidine/phosphomethylpyrimidine kinase